MDYIAMGQRIRKQRKSLHFTQEQLAEKTGISLSFLGHIERGSRKASLETAVSIANALEMSLDQMMQDSLSDSALSRGASKKDSRDVLAEISKLIEDNRGGWAE